MLIQRKSSRFVSNKVKLRLSNTNRFLENFNEICFLIQRSFGTQFHRQFGMHDQRTKTYRFKGFMKRIDQTIGLIFLVDYVSYCSIAGPSRLHNVGIFAQHCPLAHCTMYTVFRETMKTIIRTYIQAYIVFVQLVIDCISISFVCLSDSNIKLC